MGSISVYQVAEARNAECAREMMEKHDWVVPVFNGKLRIDKPALEYFAMILAYKIAGVSEGSARFFSAVCGLLLIVFTFLVTTKFINSKTAWLSSLILLASVHFVVQFRLATPDPYLVLCDVLSLYSFLMGWESFQSGLHTAWSVWKWWGIMYILLGLAVLAKGPVGLLLPALIIFIFLLIKRGFNWKTIKALRIGWGAVLTLLFCAPWYVLVHINTHGAWTRGFFLKHNMDRFSESMGGHGGIFLLTFLFVFLGMLPFSVFIVHALTHVRKQRKQNDLVLISVITLFCVVVFYAISRTKLINYTVLCYPFIAIITGTFFHELTSYDSGHKSLHIPYILLLVISICLPVAAYFWLRSSQALRPFEWIASFFIIFPVGAWSAYWLFIRKRILPSLYFIAGSFMIGTVLIFAVPYPLLDAQTPVRKESSLFGHDSPVAAWKGFNDAFVFYIRHPVPVLQDSAALQQFLEKHRHAIIISNVKNQSTPERMSDLRLVVKNHEIFNSHISYIYQEVGP